MITINGEDLDDGVDEDPDGGCPACYGMYRQGSIDCAHCGCAIECEMDTSNW